MSDIEYQRLTELVLQFTLNELQDVLQASGLPRRTAQSAQKRVFRLLAVRDDKAKEIILRIAKSSKKVSCGKYSLANPLGVTTSTVLTHSSTLAASSVTANRQATVPVRWTRDVSGCLNPTASSTPSTGDFAVVSPFSGVATVASGTALFKLTEPAEIPSDLPSSTSQIEIPGTVQSVNCYGADSIRFMEIPFFCKISDIIKPKLLRNDDVWNDERVEFNLTPFQEFLIQESTQQVNCTEQYCVQVRMGTRIEQDDSLPDMISMTVNKKCVPLPDQSRTPGIGSKMMSKLIDITKFCRLDSNEPQVIYVSWYGGVRKELVLGVSLDKCRSAEELKEEVLHKGLKPLDYMKTLVEEKLKVDSDVAATSLRVSFTCPVGKDRIVNPCRPSKCRHIQCFDLLSFLQMNQINPNWMCPVCDHPVSFQELWVDEYFTNILKSWDLPEATTDIEIKQDLSWIPLFAKKGRGNIPLQTPSKPSNVEVIQIGDSPFVPVNVTVTASITPHDYMF